MLLADDLTQLLNVLPKFIREPLEKHPNRESLIEIVLDIGRRPEARFSNTTEYFSYRRDGDFSGRMAHLIWMESHKI